MKSVLNIHWRDWCWSWCSNTLATWCEELTHLKRPWFWERLKAGGEGTDRGQEVGWHHRLHAHEFKQAPGVGDGQESLVCCSPWGWKELDTPEWLIELRLVEGKYWEIFPIKCSLVCWLACHIIFFLKPSTIHYLLFSVFFFLSSRNSKQLSVINPRIELNYTYFSCQFSVV